MSFRRNIPILLTLKPSPIHSNKSSSIASSSSPIRRSWLQRQQKDIYVKKAKQIGSPSRSIFKLEQIDKMITNLVLQKLKKSGSKREKRTIFEKGNSVLDLGAAPGSWSIYSHQKISNGLLVSVDLCPLSSTTLQKISSRNNFYFLQGDFCSSIIQQSIKDILYEKSKENDSHDCRRHLFDVVMSDMAANFTGDQHTDALRTMSLCEEALLVALGPDKFFGCGVKGQEFANDNHDSGILNKHGIFISKYFSCGQNQEKDLMDKVKGYFEHSFILKPKASRKESSEKYLVAYDYRG